MQKGTCFFLISLVCIVVILVAGCAQSTPSSPHFTTGDLVEQSSNFNNYAQNYVILNYNEKTDEYLVRLVTQSDKNKNIWGYTPATSAVLKPRKEFDLYFFTVVKTVDPNSIPTLTKKTAKNTEPTPDDIKVHNLIMISIAARTYSASDNGHSTVDERLPQAVINVATALGKTETEVYGSYYRVETYQKDREYTYWE